MERRQVLSVLFEPRSIGKVVIANRFVHSATYEGAAEGDGTVTERLLKRYSKLSEGGVGLIIPGYIIVHPLGRAHPFAMGIHTDDMVPGLRRLAGKVHEHGSKVFFHLNHAGRQTSKAEIGRTPMGPSKRWRDSIYNKGFPVQHGTHL